MIESPEPLSPAWRLHRESFGLRLGKTIGAFGLYGITFLLLNQAGGSVVTAFSVLPVALAGWLFGIGGGILGALVAFGLNSWFLFRIGEITLAFPSVIWDNNIVGTIILLMVGGGAGWLHRINHRSQQELYERMRMDQALQASEKRSRIVLENISDVISLIDRNGIILEQSPVVHKILGYSAAEMVGKKALEYVHPDDVPEMEKGFQQLLEKPRNTVSAQIRFQHKDGTWRWLYTTGTNLLEEPGIGAIISNYRDITEQILVKESLQIRVAYDQSLLRLSRKLELADSYARTMNLVSKEIETMFGFHSIWVYLNEGNDKLKLMISAGDISEVASSYTTLSVKGDPFLEEVWKCREIHVVLDAQTDPRTNKEIVSQLGNRTIVNIPLTLHENLLGFLGTGTFGDEGIRLLTSDQLEYLRSIASHMAVAISRIQLQETLEERIRFTLLLNRMTQTALETTSLSHVGQKLVDQLANLFEADACYLTLWDDARRIPIPFAASGPLREGYSSIVPIPGNVTLTESALQVQHAIVVEDKFTTSYMGPQVAAQFPEHSALVLPLIAGEQKLGAVILAYKDARTFTTNEALRGEQTAAQIALAIAKTIWLNEAHQQADAFATLYKTANILTGQQDLLSLLNIIVENAQTLLKATGGGLYLYDPLHNELETKVATHPTIPLGLKLKMGEGLAGQVAQTRQAMSLEDYQTWEFRSEKYEGIPVRAVAEVPLLYSGELIGVLVVHEVGENNRHFTEADLQLLSLFAAQATGAIYNVRLLEAERRRREEAETLREATSILAASFELDHILETLLAFLRRVVEYDSACVFLLEGDTARVKAASNHPSYNEVIGKKYPVYENELQAEIYQTGQSVILYDAQMDPRFLNWSHSEYVRGWMGIPLCVQGKILGALTVDSRQPGTYTKVEASLAQAFANQAAMAIDNARLLDAERRRREEAETLREATSTLVATLDLDQILETLLVFLRRVVAYDSACVFLREGDLVHAMAASGHPDPIQIIGKHFPLQDDRLQPEIYETGRPLILVDAQADPRFLHWGGTTYIRGWMGIPLWARGQIIGILTVDSRQPGVYTQGEASLAQAFANQAGLAIDNARLLEAERRRRTEAETLHEAASTLAASLDLDQVLENLLAALKRVVPYDSATVFLRDGDFVRAVATTGLPEPELVLNQRFSLDDNLLQPVIYRTGQPVILEDAQAIPGFLKWGNTAYVRGWMGIPLWAKGTILGALTIDSRQPGAYTPAEAALTQAFANQAAIAIDNARLLEAERRRREEAESLRQVTTALMETFDLKEILDRILTYLQRVIPYDSAHIALLEEHRLRVVVHHGFRFQEQTKVKLDIDELPHIQDILQYRRPSIISDTHHDARWIVFPGAENTQCWMGVPLIAKDRVIGILNFDKEELGYYTEEHALLATTFAGQVAVAIENARLFAEITRRQSELATLLSVSQVVSSSLDIQQVLEQVAQSITHLLDVEWSALSIYDPLTDAIRTAVEYSQSEGFTQSEIGKNYHLSDYPATHQVLISNQPLIIRTNDPEAEPAEKTLLKNIKVASALLLPLVAGGQTVGLVELYSENESHEFSREDIRLAQALADQVAIAIANAQLYAETRLRLSEMEAVNRISKALRIASKLETIFPALLQETSAILGIESSSIWLYDSLDQKLHQKDASGWFANIDEKTRSVDEGIAGKVFLSGESYQSKEFLTDPNTRDSVRPNIPAGWGGVCVPLRAGQEVVGVFFISVLSTRQLTDQEIHLFNTIAEIAGSAIHRAQLNTMIQNQLQRLLALRAIDSAISASLDLRLILNLLLEHILSELNVDAACVLLATPHSYTLRFAAGRGFYTTGHQQVVLHFGEGLAGRVAVNQEPLTVPDMRVLDMYAHSKMAQQEEFIFYTGVPLIAKGQVQGVLEVYQRSEFFAPSDWLDFLDALAAQAAIAIDSAQLFADLQHSHTEITLAYDSTLEGWIGMLDLRDKETEGHTQRVTEMTIRLAQKMGLKDEQLVHLRRGALLHDIGKLAVPDRILLKTGPLSPEEWDTMRLHPQHAFNMLSRIPFLRPALDIPHCHHEKWDGTGYPRGLKGEQIPLAARIFSVVDVWDALINDRSYRKAWPQETARAYLIEQGGTRFDPEIPKIFIKLLDES